MREGRIGARPQVRPTDRHEYTINEGGRSRHQRRGGLGRRFNPAKRLVPLSRLGWAATGSQCPLVDGLVEGIDDVTHKGVEDSVRPSDADSGIGSSRANLGRLGTR